MPRGICVLLLYLLAPAPAVAVQQPFSSHPTDLTVTNLSPRNGLPSLHVVAVIQDKQGFIWIGTPDGLTRYDGNSMKTFRTIPYDSTSLPGNLVYALHADRNGTIWVGTGYGLSAFDPGTEAFRSFRHIPGENSGLSHELVTTIIDDRSGMLWVAAGSPAVAHEAGGLHRLDPAGPSWTRYSHNPASPTSIRSNAIRALAEDRDGSLWIGSTDGLDQLDPSTGLAVRHRLTSRSDRGESEPVEAILIDSRNDLWIATTWGGVYRRNQTSGRFRALLSPGMHHDTPQVFRSVSLVEDRQGHIWVGTRGAGLFRFDPQNQSFHRHSRDAQPTGGLSSDNITSMHVDQSGLLWIGTADAGLDIYNPWREQMIRLHHEPGNETSLSFGRVIALLEDRDHFLWAATQVGLNRIDLIRGTVRRWALPGDDIGPTSLWNLFEDSRRRLWVSTSVGMIVLDRSSSSGERRPVMLFENHSLSNQSVRNVLEDSRGFYWIATNRGLNRFDPGTGETVWFLNDPDDPTSISNNVVREMAEDRAGNIWIATKGGLNTFVRAEGTFRRYLHDPSNRGGLSNDELSSVRFDEHGTLWVATFGGGLNRLDAGASSFRHYMYPSELPSNRIYRVVPDGRGVLWLATGHGVVRFRIHDGQTRVFLEEDGLASDESFDLALTSGGWIAAGSRRGLTFFAPDSLSFGHAPPPVRITAVRILDSSLVAPALREPLELAYGLNSLTFEFAILDYSAPSNHLYAYRLAGHDPDWIHAGNSRRVTYAHLGPGSYTFQVKGANSRGIWNNVGASFAFVLHPPFWHTWWFRALVAASLVLLLTAAYRVRVQRVIELERIRTRIASDLHDDIGSNLGGITMEAQLMERRSGLPSEVRERLHGISDMAHATAQSMRDIVWLIDPEHDNLDQLVLKMKDTAATLLGNAGVTFNGPSGSEGQSIPVDVKRNLFLMYKEVLHNIARHSGATEVSIEIRQQNDILTMTILDNGRGFDGDVSAFSHGLKNLRRRAAQVGGTAQVRSRPGKGTAVEITARIP